MAQLEDLWKIALGVVGLLVVFVVVAFAVVRVKRSREPNSSPPAVDASVSEADAAFLDSSHIGLEPFFGAKSLPGYDANAAGRGGEAKRRRR